MLFNTLFMSSLLVGSSYASCIHGTSHQLRRLKREGGVEVANFAYTGDKGPFNWATLAEANSACAISKQQSPINIDASVARARVAPQINFPAIAEAEFENIGTTLEVVVPAAAGAQTKLGNQTFALKQFHFHSPSEHRVNEEFFPLEMHMVHEATDGSGAIAVMTALFQLTEDGSTTELITQATKNLAQVANPGTVTKTGALDFKPLTDHFAKSPLVEYAGSLTTPPCSEGPVFVIAEQPLPLNVATFNAMKSVIKFNSRFTQNAVGKENIIETGAKVAAAAARAAPPAAQKPAASAVAPPAAATKSKAAASAAASATSSAAGDAAPPATETRKAAAKPPAAANPPAAAQPVAGEQFITITEMDIAGRKVATTLIARVAAKATGAAGARA